MQAFKLIRTLSSKANFWPLLAVLFFGWLASRALFGTGYFNMHDDLQMMRQLQLEKCLLDGQIPCRWVPDMGFGYGFPLFNFYPPLPYFVGVLIRLVGFSFVDTAKGLFIIAFMASGLTMYYFAKEFFGRLGGVLSAVFYIWAPYHAVDIYVRGAMNEAWALIFFPLCLWAAYKLISSPQMPASKNKFSIFNFKFSNFSSKWVLALGLSWFGLLTSHNLMVLIFTPIFALWCLLWIARKKAWWKVPSLIAAGAWSFVLAAFFTLPVVFEQKYVHADTLVQGYYEYIAHFASIRQILFSRFWGYGPSVWMDLDDKMSFQIGHLHWILPILVVGVLAWQFLKKRKTNNLFLVVVFFFIAGWFAAFMTHSRSVPVWQAFSPFAYVQFPWRFLTIVILSFSFVVGSIAKLLPKALALLVSVILMIFLVIWNSSYFLPETGKLGPVTDQQKFSGVAWDMQRTAGIFDYLPKSAKQNPRDSGNEVAEILEGEAQILNPQKGSDWASFEIDVASPEARLRINIYQFPDWRVFVDDQEVEVSIPEEELWGRMHISVPQGRHEVYAKLYNTPIRTFSNVISLVAWIALLLLIIRNAKTAR